MKKIVLLVIAFAMVPVVVVVGVGLLAIFTISTAAAGPAPAASAPTISGDAALPLDQPISMTDGYGPRPVRVVGASTWHPAVDLIHGSPSCGASVYAIVGGTVSLSSALYLSIKNPDGYTVSYLHMFKSQRIVDVGDTVQPGQKIGVVGNVAPSTGCHLDVRVNVAGNTNPAVAALKIPAGAPGPWVNPEEFVALFGLTLCPPDSCRRIY